MAKRSFAATWASTGTGTADNSALTTGKYQSLDPGSASQGIQILEFYLGGLSTSSAVQNMQVRRASTAAATPTALSSPNADGPINNISAAVTTVPIACVAATTQPTPSNSTTVPKLMLAFNAFGGVVRWVAAPGEEWWMVGTGNNVATTLSNNTGSGDGVIQSHIVYELL